MPGPWSHLLDKTITYQLRDGVTNSGDPTFASQVTTKARIDERVIRISDAGGNEERGVRWETKTTLTTEVHLPMGSRVWLPGADTGVVNESITVVKSGGSNLPGSSFMLYEAIL